MYRTHRAAAVLIALCALLGACNGVTAMTEPQPAPVPGFVVDEAAFQHYVDSRPTPQQFRSVYPDVQLVLPGDIATKEYRMNNSRYFAKLDAEGRIVGGKFM